VDPVPEALPGADPDPLPDEPIPLDAPELPTPLPD
jgi:hypothetical protein